jgi:hypothetical protein
MVDHQINQDVKVLTDPSDILPRAKLGVYFLIGQGSKAAISRGRERRQNVDASFENIGKILPEKLVECFEVSSE